MDRGAGQTTVHGVAKESDMTQWLNNNNNPGVGVGVDAPVYTSVKWRKYSLSAAMIRWYGECLAHRECSLLLPFLFLFLISPSLLDHWHYSICDWLWMSSRWPLSAYWWSQSSAHISVLPLAQCLCKNFRWLIISQTRITGHLGLPV